MRTHKIAAITLFHADANEKNKEDSQASRTIDRGVRESNSNNNDDDNSAIFTRQKCRVWFVLSQELTAIVVVAFLLLICLPVLAFWFMFLGVLVTSFNIFNMLKRVWNDAHSQQQLYSGVNNDDISIMDYSGDECDAEDIEFSEFLVNFSPDETRKWHDHNNITFIDWVEICWKIIICILCIVRTRKLTYHAWIRLSHKGL